MAPRLSLHFSDEHKYTELKGTARFECKVCGLPGIGKKIECQTCDLILHNCCQKSHRGYDCWLHPEDDSINGKHKARFRQMDRDAQCTVCGKGISAPTHSYACERNNSIVAHFPCLLVQSKIDYPNIKRPVDWQGFQLHRQISEQYSCKTCGTVGFGKKYRSQFDSGNHHPYCVDRSRHTRKAFCPIHFEALHGLDWKAPPPVDYNLPCLLCLDKITGYHFSCCKGGGTLHPMCAKLACLDQGVHLGREWAKAVFTFGLSKVIR